MRTSAARIGGLATCAGRASGQAVLLLGRLGALLLLPHGVRVGNEERDHERDDQKGDETSVSHDRNSR